MGMSDGGNDMNEGRRENTRLNIGRHDNLHAEIHVLSFLSSSHLLPQMELPSASSPHTGLPRIVRQSSGTITNLPSQMRLPWTSHTLFLAPPPRGKPPLTNYPLLTSLYMYTSKCNIRLLPFSLCNFLFSPSYTIYHPHP